MHLSQLVLGSSTVKTIQEKNGSAVLIIGKDRYTRGDLSRLDCFNFIAAQNLTAALRDLGVRDTAEVYAHMPPDTLIQPRVGAIALAVLGAAFEAKGVGDLESWVKLHQGKDDIVTVHTMKTRHHHREELEKKAQKREANTLRSKGVTPLREEADNILGKKRKPAHTFRRKSA